MQTNKIFIQCGIKGDQVDKSFFWPVLQVTPLPRTWLPPLDARFSLLFTSKFAINLFLKLLKKKTIEAPILENIDHLGAVGCSTAQLIEKELLPFFSYDLKKKILFPQQEGLFHLLKLALFSNKSKVYIFTALNGKTQETIQFIEKSHLEFTFEIVALYQLDPFLSNYLQNLFTNCCFYEKKADYIFCCRSGRVLKECVSQLLTFFSCEDISQLPKNIYFSGEKQSVQNEIQALDLIDRTIS